MPRPANPERTGVRIRRVQQNREIQGDYDLAFPVAGRQSARFTALWVERAIMCI